MVRKKLSGTDWLLLSSMYQTRKTNKDLNGVASSVALIQKDMKNQEKTRAKEAAEAKKLQSKQLAAQERSAAANERNLQINIEEKQQKEIQKKAKEFVFQVRQKLSIITKITSNFERTLALQSLRGELAKVEFTSELLPEIADKEYHQATYEMMISASSDAIESLTADELSALQELSDRTQLMQDLDLLQEIVLPHLREDETHLEQLDLDGFRIEVEEVLNELPEEEQKILRKQLESRKPSFKFPTLTGPKLFGLLVLLITILPIVEDFGDDSLSSMYEILVVLLSIYVQWRGLKWVWRKLRKNKPDTQESSIAEPTATDTQRVARGKVMAIWRKKRIDLYITGCDKPREIREILDIKSDSNLSLDELASVVDSNKADLDSAIEINLSGKLVALPGS